MRPRNLLKPVPAALMLGLVSNRLVNVLAPDDLVWRLHDVTLSACFALAALWALQLVPYRNLLCKCMAALIVGLAWVDLACVLLNAPGYWYWLAAQLAAGVTLASVYFWRSYDQDSDEVESGYLYCLRTRPNSMQDFLIAMLGIYGSNGGYALFANGKLYRYRRGQLCRQKLDRVPLCRYHITRGARITPAMIDELDSLIGERWTWQRNCLTVLGPLWSKYRG